MVSSGWWYGRAPKGPSGWLVVLLAMILLCGCRTTPKSPVADPQPRKDTAEMDTWEEATRAFCEGSYDQAMAVFEFLSESTGDEDMYRRALYGLATTKLVVAQSAGEFNEAMQLWDCWIQQLPAKLNEEDPRMMAPLLDRIGSLLHPGPQPKKQAKNESKIVYVHPLVQRNAAGLKGLLDTKEKEIVRLKSRLEAREREVRRLRHQIESLEAIHLKFQEKQKEVASP